MPTSQVDTAALIERVTEFAPLVAQTVASIVRSRNWAKLSWPDLMQAGFLGLLEACHEYDPARSSFRTYASRRIDWAVKACIREDDHARLQLVDELPDRPDPAPRHDRAYELKEALDSLSPRQRQVLQLRLSGYMQESVAVHLNISQAAVQRLEQRALQHLRKRRQRPLDRAA